MALNEHLFTFLGAKRENALKKISYPFAQPQRGVYLGSNEDLTLNSVPVPTFSGSRVRKAPIYFFPESSVIQSNELQTSTSANSTSIQEERSPKLNVQTIEPPMNMLSPPSSARSFLFTVKSATSKKLSCGNDPELTRPSTRALSIVSIDEQFQRDDEVSLAGDFSETASEFGGRRSTRRSNVADRRKQFGKTKINADPIRRSFDSETALRSSTEGGLDQGFRVLSPHFESPLDQNSRVKGNSSESVLLDRLTPHKKIPPIRRDSKAGIESSSQIEKMVKDDVLKGKLISATQPADFQHENPGDVFQLVLDEKDKQKVSNEPTTDQKLSPEVDKEENSNAQNQNSSENGAGINKPQDSKKKVQISKDAKTTAEASTKQVKEDSKENADTGHVTVAREVTKSAPSPNEHVIEKEKMQIEQQYMQQLNKARQKISAGSNSSVTSSNPKQTNTPNGAKMSTGTTSNSTVNERPKAAQVNKNKPGKEKEKSPTNQKPDEANNKQKQVKTETKTQNGKSNTDAKMQGNKPAPAKNAGRKVSSDENGLAKTVPATPAAKVGNKSAANNQSNQSKGGTSRKSSVSSQVGEKENVVTVKFDGSKAKVSNNATTSENQTAKETSPVSKQTNPDKKETEADEKEAQTKPGLNEVTAWTPLIKNAIDSISKDALINSQAAFESELSAMTAPSIPVKKFEVKKTKPDPKLISTKSNTQNTTNKKPPAPKSSTAKMGKKTGNGSAAAKDDAKNANSDVIPNDVKGSEREKSNLDAVYKNSDPGTSVLISGTNWHISIPMEPIEKLSDAEGNITVQNSDNDVIKSADSNIEVNCTENPSVSVSGSSHSSARRLSEEEKLQFYKLLGNTLIKEGQISDENRSESDTMTQIDDDKFLDDINELLGSDYVRPLTGDPFKEIRPLTSESHTDRRLSGEEEFLNIGRRGSNETLGSLEKLTENQSIIKKNTDPENEVFNNCGRGVYDIQEESWTSTMHSLKSNISSGTSTLSGNSEVYHFIWQRILSSYSVEQ